MLDLSSLQSKGDTRRCIVVSSVSRNGQAPSSYECAHSAAMNHITQVEYPAPFPAANHLYPEREEATPGRSREQLKTSY